MNEYEVVVRAFWPPASDDGERKLFLSMRLHRRGEVPKPRFDPRHAGYPQLLTCIDRLLIQAGRLAFDDGYVARVDVARPFSDRAPWPRWCLTWTQFSSLVATLSRDAASNDAPGFFAAYPISVWLIPSEKDGAEASVSLFRSLPFDEVIAEQMFANGVVRISLWDAFCDVIAAESVGSRALAWFDTARRDDPQGIVWKVQPG